MIDASPARTQATETVHLWRRLLSHRSVVVGGILFALVLVAALFAGWLAPFDPLDTDPTNALQPPGRDHWMGTDQLGRDIFSRVIHGARPSLIMGVAPMIISSIIGTASGMIIGYYGRWADLMMTRFSDIALAFPPILLALTVVAVLGPGLWSIALALGLSGIPFYLRMARGQVIQAKEAPFVQTAVSIGAGDARVMFRHIIYRVFPPILVMMTIHVAGAILAGAALSFLGLGIPPPTAEWGTMIQDGRQFLVLSWWMAFFPGVALAITVFATNLLGDGLRDVIDPRSKGEPIR
ncbi:MAG: ABC transporter permease [Acidimicrobiia bacterium]|nr:ABC transporter permease [bacterium]MXW69152.1 ABC transporter permease [Acidimicrobiia bacterium]MDE0674320.1 ABC transporter permease [bacterium]MXX01460.1 ABC transporter permease [Acidimicrobiia bacterium]MXX44836.1 ABC transporter permease [Acidimicrobiia bacterium]